MVMMEKFLLNKFFSRLPRFVSHIYVTFVILVSFVLFNGVGVSGAVSDIGGLFGAGGIPFITKETAYYLSGYALVLVMAIIGATPIVKGSVLKLKQNARANAVINILEPIFIVAMLIIVTAYFVDGSFSPFLYFRF